MTSSPMGRESLVCGHDGDIYNSRGTERPDDVINPSHHVGLCGEGSHIIACCQAWTKNNDADMQ